MSRGGKREGAGRPAGKNYKKVTVRIEPDVWDEFKNIAESQEIGVNSYVRAIVKKEIKKIKKL